MKHSMMKKQNWIVLGLSIALLWLGFILMRLITRNYDGVLAFVTILMSISGIVGIILALSMDFSKKDVQEQD